MSNATENIIKLNNILDVKSFGAKGDGLTDDTEAIQSALNSGSAIYFPPGTYNVSSVLTVSNKSIAIYGAGRGVSVLSWVSAGGLAISQSSSNFRTSIHDLRFAASVANCGTAISLTGIAGGGLAYTLDVHNVNIDTNSSVALSSWNRGIYTDNARTATLSEIMIRGREAAVYDMTVGIHFDDLTTQTPVEVFISKVFVYSASVGIDFGNLATGNNEGMYVEQCAVVSCDIGIRHRTFNDSPLLFIRGCHIAARQYCIYTSRIVQAIIEGNLLYVRDDTTVDFVGIYFNGDNAPSSAADSVIANNVIRCNNTLTSTTDGIFAVGSRINISSNMIFNADTGITVPAGTTNPALLFNQTRNTTTPYSIGNSTTFAIETDGTVVSVRNPGANDSRFIFGEGSPASRSAYFDLIGDNTYTSFGLRIQRQGGADTGSNITHRGTGAFSINAQDAGSFVVQTNNQSRFSISPAGNVSLSAGSLVTTATDGFPYIPTMNGTPTGVPTALAGRAPMVVDATSNLLYVYIGGSWKSTTLV